MPKRSPKPTSPPTAPHDPDSHIEVIARALILRRGRLLVCRSLRRGYCYLPGGHVEFGEPAATALARELMEEAGLVITVGPLLATGEEVFETRGRRHHEVNLIFRATADFSGPMFHVEPRSPGPRRGPGRGATYPPVPSLEPDIAFEWIPVRAPASADLRPASIAHWLAAGRRGRWLGKSTRRP